MVERRRSRRGARGHRRGATVVLVVLMMSALLGASALAIDFARLYTGINEMQTAADAAALHGALYIQKTPNSGVISSVQQFAATYNKALGGFVAPPDVKPYHYEEADPSKNGVLPGWTDARLNAVQVTVTRTSGLLMLGRLVKAVIPAPTRTATAWVANLTGNTCVRPWAFAVGYVINRANPSVANTVERSVSFSEMASLRSQSSVRFVLAPPGTSPTVGQIQSTYGGALYGGNWAALDFTDKGGGSSTSIFNTCSIDSPISEGARVPAAASPSIPALGNSLDKTPRGGQPVCTSLQGSLCINNGQVGGPVVMTFAYNNAAGVGAFGVVGQEHVVARVGSFVLVCLKRAQNGANAGCSQANSFNVNWNSAALGTILGYLDFSVPTFTGNYSLGTGAGAGGATQQRLILVDAPIRNAP